MDTVLGATNAVSGSFPPLQAATSLVLYIQQSIELFKSNKNEIVAIGTYSERLSTQLARHEASVDPGKTSEFVNVIKKIHAYVQTISKKNGIVQYLRRRTIAEQLQGYRNSLGEEFAVFSITSDVDIQQFQREAESARKADEHASQEVMKDLSIAIEQNSAGLCRLAGGLGSSTNQSRNTVFQELTAIDNANEETRNPEEKTVLQEGLRLTREVPRKYKWYSDTFRTGNEYREAEVKSNLAYDIDDVISDLREGDLLSATTNAALDHEKNTLEKVNILFRILNARARDAVLIRSFQWAISRSPNAKEMLREGLINEQGELI
ncbi:hypothetical protein C8R44DRAFT_735851 [Mycena epipterygia]|nr:hypothetical protein C8R44DRAFT_735851 [Mycena epipterygia]